MLLIKKKRGRDIPSLYPTKRRAEMCKNGYFIKTDALIRCATENNGCFAIISD